jgi:hypothetical protein
LTADASINIDIVCLSCHYNLRGLQADGLCPECGERVDLSIWHWEQEQNGIVVARPLSASDPRWLVNLQEGLSLVPLTGLALLVVLTAPYRAFDEHTWSRFLMATLSAAGSAFGWLTAWKLSSPEPRRPTIEPRLARWTLRISATLFACFPLLFWKPVRNFLDGSGETVAIVVLSIGLCVAPCAYYVRCSRLLGRSGSFGMAITSVAVAVSMPVVMLASLIPRTFDGGFDAIMATAGRSIVLGPIGLTIELMEHPSSLRTGWLMLLVWLLVIQTAIIVMHVSLMKRAAGAIRRAHRRDFRERLAQSPRSNSAA